MQNCSGDNVGVLEMHGTGTGLGDPIEVGAAFAVFRTAAADMQPLELQVSTPFCYPVLRSDPATHLEWMLMLDPRTARTQTCRRVQPCIPERAIRDPNTSRRNWNLSLVHCAHRQSRTGWLTLSRRRALLAWLPQLLAWDVQTTAPASCTCVR